MNTTYRGDAEKAIARYTAYLENESFEASALILIARSLSDAIVRLGDCMDTPRREKAVKRVINLTITMNTMIDEFEAS